MTTRDDRACGNCRFVDPSQTGSRTCGYFRDAAGHPASLPVSSKDGCTRERCDECFAKGRPPVMKLQGSVHDGLAALAAACELSYGKSPDSPDVCPTCRPLVRPRKDDR